MSDMSKQQVPKIRFKGFGGIWGTEKLKDMSSLITKGTTPQDKNWTGPIKYIKTDSIDSISGKLRVTDYTSLEEHQGYLKRSQLKNNDILFSIVGTLGRVGLVQNSDLPANTNQQISIIRLKKNDVKFIFNSLKTDSIKSFIKSDSTVGAQPSLSLWQIEGILINVPSVEEQAKIGEIFQKLDRAIELQQQKVEQSERYKKAMLQKMFPKKGETKPQLRFEGFSGEWKLSVLNKLADRFDNLRIPVTASDRIEGETPYYGANGIQGYVEGFTHEGEFVLLAEDGANDLTNYPVQHVFGKIWVNNHAHVLGAKKNIMSNSYLANVLKTINMIPYLVGSGRAKLNSSAMMEIKIKYPTLEEQTLIGNLFQKLDQNIKFEKKKLEQYQTMKRAMLQRMFV